LIEANDTLCGDPANGEQKQINIRYECQGKEQTITVTERATANLSCN